jgi:hypothetical protein
MFASTKTNQPKLDKLDKEDLCISCLKRPSLESLDTNFCEECFVNIQLNPLRKKAIALRKDLKLVEEQIDAAQRCLRNSQKVDFRLRTCYRCHKTFDSQKDCQNHEPRCIYQVPVSKITPAATAGKASQPNQKPKETARAELARLKRELAAAQAKADLEDGDLNV